MVPLTKHPRTRIRRIAGTSVTGLLLANLLILSSSAQTTPAPGQTATTFASTVSPTSTVSPSPAPVAAKPKPNSVTDTEYLSVRIDANGRPLDVDVKEWYRVRRPKGGEVRLEDPGVLDDVRSAGGARPSVGDKAISANIDVGDLGFADMYLTGKPIPAKDGMYRTSAGPQPLPIDVNIRYYTGEPGSDEATKQVNAREFGNHHGPFKLVIGLVNNTKRTEEVKYNDVQTKQPMTGVAEVSTPFSVKIPELVLPDGQFDALRSNGVIGRKNKASVVSWNLYLAPPDYPNEQHAIVEGRVNSPTVPRIDVIAQPVYPEPVAQALSSSGQQFQKGRRSFYYDVMNLLRENLIALGGLFSVLDDSFSNLALPLIGPEKGNRDSGSFTDANLLWGVWTIAKGTEQLGRAVDDLTYAVQLTRDGLKGEIGTLQLLRSFIGKSTDTPVLSTTNLIDATGCLADPANCEAKAAAQVNQLLSESIWANLKDLEITLGADPSPNIPGGPGDPRPYLPEAPASVIPTNPSAGVAITVIKLKLAIMEHDFYCMVYEDHSNECSSILGLTNKPGATGWDKFSFVKFPFGQIELEKGLRAIEDEGLVQIQQALGNKIQPNSFIWGTKTIVEGIEALVDSFHQLNATFRYVSDSIQNFGLFGIETSRSILQLDINAIDIQTAAKAAANKRALQANTFFGKPKDSHGQLVLSFSTHPEPIQDRTGGQRAAVGLGIVSLLSVGLLFARFKLFWI